MAGFFFPPVLSAVVQVQEAEDQAKTISLHDL